MAMAVTIVGGAWHPTAAHASGPTSLPCGAQPSPVTLSVDKAGEAELLAATNRERAAAGVAPLSERGDITLIAEAHARVMALAGAIFHNDGFFSSANKALLDTRYQGENVSCAMDVAQSHAGLMNSTYHRENILNPRFTHAGYAVVAAPDGHRYVVQNFLQGSGAAAVAPAAPAPAPAPATAPAPAPKPAPAPAPKPAPAPAPMPAPAPAVTAPPTTTPPPPPEPSTAAAPTATTAAPTSTSTVDALPITDPPAAPTKPAVPHLEAGATAAVAVAVGAALRARALRRSARR
jgi:hypothetical protein